jgi:hypothetical protein
MPSIIAEGEAAAVPILQWQDSDRDMLLTVANERILVFLSPLPPAERIEVAFAGPGSFCSFKVVDPDGGCLQGLARRCESNKGHRP